MGQHNSDSSGGGGRTTSRSQLERCWPHRRGYGYPWCRQFAKSPQRPVALQHGRRDICAFPRSWMCQTGMTEGSGRGSDDNFDYTTDRWRNWMFRGARCSSRHRSGGHGSGHLRGVRQSALTKLRDIGSPGVVRIGQPVPLDSALDGLRDRVRSPVRQRVRLVETRNVLIVYRGAVQPVAQKGGRTPSRRSDESWRCSRLH